MITLPQLSQLSFLSYPPRPTLIARPRILHYVSRRQIAQDEVCALQTVGYSMHCQETPKSIF